jgi:hypothetical protein
VKLYCAGATDTCELPLPQGSECELATVPCAEGTTCVRGTVDEIEKCRAPVQVGQPCSFNQNCEAGAYCDLSAPVFERLCVAERAEGAPCDASSRCGAGLYCGSVHHVCVASPGDTRPCVVPAICEADAGCSPCATGLTCDAGTCRHRASAGQDCTTRACGDALRCLPGTPSQCDPTPDPTDCSGPLGFADPRLDEAVHAALLEPSTLPAWKVAQTTFLDLNSSGISDYRGLECFTNMEQLWISNNGVTSLSIVTSMTRLTDLYAWDNQLTDLSPLAGLTQLRYLLVANNHIVDLTPLKAKSWVSLDLRANDITDLSPLADATWVEGSSLSLEENPFDCVAQAGVLQALAGRGVVVTSSCP